MHNVRVYKSQKGRPFLFYFALWHFLHHWKMPFSQVSIWKQKFPLSKPVTSLYRKMTNLWIPLTICFEFFTQWIVTIPCQLHFNFLYFNLPLQKLLGPKLQGIVFHGWPPFKIISHWSKHYPRWLSFEFRICLNCDYRGINSSCLTCILGFCQVNIFANDGNKGYLTN